MTPARGTGGLPPRRPDQQVSQPAVAIQPGSQTGVLRARIVQVIGGPNSGVFVYSGAPGAGTLIASLAGSTTADSFGNSVVPDSLTFYGTAGNDITIGLEGPDTFIQFLTGASFEGVAANMAAGVAGSGGSANMQLNISGPRGDNPFDDWVQIEMISGNAGGSATAEGFLNYINTAGIPGAVLTWGSGGVVISPGRINSITPGTFSLTSPGATAGAPPTGTATQASSFASGSPALSYLTAFASTYNVTVAAVSNLVNGLSGWGV
jgi:hypothetical protein